MLGCDTNRLPTSHPTNGHNVPSNIPQLPNGPTTTNGHSNTVNADNDSVLTAILRDMVKQSTQQPQVAQMAPEQPQLPSKQPELPQSTVATPEREQPQLPPKTPKQQQLPTLSIYEQSLLPGVRERLQSTPQRQFQFPNLLEPKKTESSEQPALPQKNVVSILWSLPLLLLVSSIPPLKVIVTSASSSTINILVKNRCSSFMTA
jgi:hypothetical protein